VKVAVTGASGFVGRAVVEALARTGHHPVAITRGQSGDLLAADLAPLFEGCDAVVNCAARVHVMQREDPITAERAFHAMNAELPVRMATVAKACGVRRFVQLSSVAAISSISPGHASISDNSSAQPESPYGRAKRAADEALATMSDDAMTTVSLRPPAIYGPGVGAFFAMLMRAAKLGLPLPVGHIHNGRSFAFVDNIADAAVAAVQHSATGPHIVTDSPPISTADLYRRLLTLYGHGDRVWNWPAPIIATAAKLLLRSRAQSFIGSAAYDGSRFAETFGWQPPTSMDEALALTVTGHR
jgi:nucleoside-diphosphate-sugar epimerase